MEFNAGGKVTPKIFVGTMHTCEGDLETSLLHVQRQKGVVVTHYLVSGLKEKEAHNALWKAWRDGKNGHDLFVKVDADTVLSSPTTLAEIYELFHRNTRVTGLQAPLHDYMTNDFINGLNAFSPRVTFNDTQDELYCDRKVDVDHDIVLRGDDLPNSLRPAGLHCHYANEKQAFHYGVHRALKGQTVVLNKVHNAFVTHHHETQNRVRGFALIGSQFSTKFMHNRKFNYTDVEFLDAFEEAKQHYDELTNDRAFGGLD